MVVHAHLAHQPVAPHREPIVRGEHDDGVISLAASVERVLIVYDKRGRSYLVSPASPVVHRACLLLDGLIARHGRAFVAPEH